MRCSDLRELSLEDIKKNNDEVYKNDRDSAYHHVVYLITDDEESLRRDQEVWNSSNEYLTITRIHFAKPTDHQEQYSDFIKHLNCLATIQDFSDIVWNTYYTTELSDMVLVTRSKRFKVLARWALLSTKTNLVGDAYTYFCLPSTFIIGDEKPINDALDVIDFLSIRFSVKDNRADEQMDIIRQCLGEHNTQIPYGVAGNEDAMIYGRNIPIQNLMDFYRICYDQKYALNKVFRDIITRIGTDWGSIPFEYTNPKIDPPKSLLAESSNRVLNKVYTEIIDKYQTQLSDREWLRPIVELTNALVHMSSSAALDEPVFLILPALSAFWDNVLQELSNSLNSDNLNILPDDTMYCRFSELCVHTLEHLMRAEGQLSQRPEVRPLAYDIPVFVLEYATAFLRFFNNIITDYDDTSRIFTLLVPSTDRMVSTEELFEANNGVPGLLQITVPFSLLYSPDRLLPTLCHELAHYVGEAFRLRKLRYDLFLRVAALEMQEELFVIGNDSGGLKRFLVEQFFNEGFLNVRANHGLVSCDSDLAEVPLISIFDMIVSTVDKLSDFKMYSAFLKEYLLSEDYSGTQVYPIPVHSLAPRLETYYKRLNELRILFRETYADLCMLHFLKISPQKYFDVTLRDWNSINDGMLMQIYIALSVNGYYIEDIKNEIKVWGTKFEVEHKQIVAACYDLDRIYNLINGENEKSVKYLYQYIESCKTELTKIFQYDEDSNDNEMVKMYKQIVEDDSDYKSILATIDKSRGDILKYI